MFEVTMTKRAEKSVAKMPASQVLLLAQLVDDLEKSGPVQPQWPNYSKLGGKKHHCHLSHRWVACWEETKTGVQIEVYYAGSRGSAPY
ncbi:MAG: hypothetical protein LBC85_08925 [Fibromonadaceae bacterium]|jgi:hypothetical protein|nr:hypothetical protein [Fibromonadaceae bacterium]